MKNIYRYFILLLAAVFAMAGNRAFAQDPIFSQFFSSPLSISPALSGNGDADWRLVGNLRSQSLSNGGGSLNTKSLSFDGKLFRQKTKPTNYIGGGLLFLQDAGLGGAYKTTNITGMVSSHVDLDGEDIHGLSVGLGGTYSNTLIDYDALSFGSQLGSAGFNRTLPTGETYLTQVQPYFSLSAGATYTWYGEYSNFDIGVAGYRFMKTVRSAMNDTAQVDPPRYNFHADFQGSIDERNVFSAAAMYVLENDLSTYTLGVNFGRILDESEALPTVINLGLWYRGNQAVIPYAGIMYKGLQLGLTYDLNVGSSKNAVGALKTFELSLVFRSPKRAGRGLPCPWK